MPTVSKINVTPVEETKPPIVVEEPPTYANKMVRRAEVGQRRQSSLLKQRGVGVGKSGDVSSRSCLLHFWNVLYSG